MSKTILPFLLLFCLSCFAQMTKAERKAERQRVKAEQKLLNEQAKEEKKAAAERAKYAPTWAVIDAAPDLLKSEIIKDMTVWGYSIDSETEHQVSFVKETSGRDSLLATMFMGNAYSENPKRHLQFTLTPDDAGTRVDCSGAITVRMPFGKVNRMDITNNKNFKADLLGEYDGLKSWAGHQKELKQAHDSKAEVR